jgi:hypothetical protein
MPLDLCGLGKDFIVRPLRALADTNTPRNNVSAANWFSCIQCALCVDLKMPYCSYDGEFYDTILHYAICMVVRNTKFHKTTY